MQRVLVASGAVAWTERRHRDDVRVLAYHNVVPDGTPRIGDASLHLPLGEFRRQLDYISRRFDVVPLAEVSATPRAARRARPRAVITFDDAYQGAVVMGVEEIARRGLPATIFVAPALLGRQSLWWDAVAPGGRGSSDGLTDAMRHRALTAHRGEGGRIHAWAKESGWSFRDLPDCMLTASEDELSVATHRHEGLTLGSHSWSHPNLAALPPNELEPELRQPLAWLGRTGRSVAWLAYPYGLATPAVMKRAQMAGYEGAALVAGGWVRPGQGNAFAIPRVNVPSRMSESAFAVRISGLTQPRVAR